MLKHEVQDNAQLEGADDAEALARRARARDPAAWAQIFDRHYRSIFAFARYRLAGADEAEDVAAQVFEIAFARADSFDYRGVGIESWLLGIARNLVRDHFKKRGRRGMAEELDESNTPVEADPAPALELHRDIVDAMRRLTEDQQEVIALRFLLDRPVAETAALMNRSEEAVKNLQRRALAAMRRALGAYEYPGDAP